MEDLGTTGFDFAETLFRCNSNLTALLMCDEITKDERAAMKILRFKKWLKLQFPNKQGCNGTPVND